MSTQNPTTEDETIKANHLSSEALEHNESVKIIQGFCRIMGVHPEDLEHGLPSPVTEQKAHAMVEFVKDFADTKVKEAEMNNLERLAAEIHASTHADPDKSHGFTDDDVMYAAVLLHAIVMDVGASRLLPMIGQGSSEKRAYEWGKSLHDNILLMTGVDTHLMDIPSVTPSNKSEKDV